MSNGEALRKKHILDRSFRYVPSVETDIRATFRRERKRIAEEKKKADAIKSDERSRLVAGAATT